MERLQGWALATDEEIVDYGIGSSEMQAGAAARLAGQEVARLTAWRALPVWTRASRRVRWRWWSVRERLTVAWRALRTGDCE